MYRFNAEMWPQKDPITNRNVCHACWNVHHKICGKMHTTEGQIQCDHFFGRGVKRNPSCTKCKFECDCVHLSEAYFADIEKAKIRDSSKARRKLERDALADPASPLRAVNPKVRLGA